MRQLTYAGRPSIFLACIPPNSTILTGCLLAIGGHEQRQASGEDTPDKYPEFILQRFVEELPGQRTIVLIPTASEEPAAAAQDYLDAFTALGVKDLEVLGIQSRAQANSAEALAILNRADGVLFTGGDQLRLTALLGGTAVLARLNERYLHEPIIIAGTSAGAAAMSTPMIYQGRNNAGFLKDEIHITTGLQLLHDVAIDTHFIKRGRIVRMAQILPPTPAASA